MTHQPSTTRRGVLAAGTLGAGAAILAGCGSGADCGWLRDGAPPDGMGSRELATLDEIAVGEAVAVMVDDFPFIVSRPTDSTVVAFSAVCPHKGCQVEPDGEQLRCPPHDARFNAATGAVERGPAKDGLRQIEVTVTDGKVMTVA